MGKRWLQGLCNSGSSATTALIIRINAGCVSTQRQKIKNWMNLSSAVRESSDRVTRACGERALESGFHGRRVLRLGRWWNWISACACPLVCAVGGCRRTRSICIVWPFIHSRVTDPLTSFTTWAGAGGGRYLSDRQQLCGVSDLGRLC